jgi:protein disulfide-isomerase A6
MYAVPAGNQAATKIRNDLDLGSEKVAVIASNMKRGWWRRYPGYSYDVLDLESFVDAIKLGEGSKSKLPAGFRVGTEEVPVPESSESSPEDAEPELEPEPSPATEGTEPDPSLAEPEPAETPVADHDEL